MWKRFACYFWGRHGYSVYGERGKLFLRCPHCGQRSRGWHLDEVPIKYTPVRPSTAIRTGAAKPRDSTSQSQTGALPST